ncbi:MAG TPA: hypothetical protein VLM38_00065 [Blastocatellia bacterium]|nr:hypothetical protein [Blastocatellia bacterium]
MATFTPDDESGRERQPARKVTLIKNSWRGLCIAIFVFGAVSFLQAHKRADSLQSGGQSIDVSDKEPAQSFVVEYSDSLVSSDGTLTNTGDTTRYVKADGDWRLVIRRRNGPELLLKRPNRPAVYGASSDGVYEKEGSSQTRRYVSPSADQTMLQLFRSHNYLRSSPEFVRTDRIAGLKVYVWRVDRDAANPVQWTEESYSPKTGFTPLRTIIHFRDGSEIRREAVSIEFKDVPEELNHDIKDLPVKNTEPKEHTFQ